MAFSRKTYVKLAESLGELTHEQIRRLFYEHRAEASDPDPSPRPTVNRPTRALALIRNIEARGEAASEPILRELLELVLSNPFRRDNSPALLASLAVDGYEWANDRLVVAMPVPVPLRREITQLETTLDGRGLAEAKTHYEQAVDNFTDGNFEAANGQLRSFLESLFVALAVQRGAQANVGEKGAIDYLRRNNDLDEPERQWLRALWDSVQDDGPHAGLAEPAEARFRLHVATAAASYLLGKIQ